ncbi:MAG TPA: PAS domain S-box protein [Trichormus sp. M33_DOE_039]|nr:PAS domain S-box protein [Trichormus sp. M33_DOE_039]
MAVWTLWYPTYWSFGLVKALTAIISVYTAVVAVELLPKALEIPSTNQLESANQKLQQEIIERQRVEDALRDSERRFRAIFDQTFQFMGLLHPDGTLLEANQTALNFGGLMYADVINRPFWETEWWTVGETTQNRLKAAIAQATSGQFFRAEFDVRGAENTQTTVDFSLKPVFDDTGKVVLLIAEGRDICERKQAETALHRAHHELEIRVQERTIELLATNQALQEEILERQRVEAELQKQALLLDLTQDSIIVRDLNGRIDFWNRGAEEMYGWTKAEAIGQISHTLLKTKFPQPMAEIAAELWQHGRWVGELVHTKRDGTPIVVDSRWTLQRDEQGRAEITLEINNDITARKRAEEELSHLSRALESAVEGISQLDTQGRYIKVNPAYANAVGYQPEELIGMDWQLTVHPEDLVKLKAAYEQMLTHGKVEAEGRAIRKDKSLFDKQVVMVKAYDQQERFIGHYCFMKDISDRREVERLKDEFVSVVSHELRTPLTSISGALDLLASGVLQTQPEDAQRMLNIAASNTERLVRLINDILDIERIASGKVEMNREICNAADLMNQSVEVMEEMATQARVTLSIAPISAQIWADSDRIIQVFTNLLSNAIKFSPPDSTVWLSAELVTGEENQKATFPTLQAADATFPYILFQVKDQGRGIPAEKLESIFERFGQVDASDSRQKGGTGLGLAICRTILQHHGGNIWVESSLGEGSTFFFTLPMITEADTRTSSLPVTSTPWETDATSLHIPCLSPHPPLVLACDDDPSIRVVLQTMLERQGYRVMAVASGQEAVEQAKVHHPDVVILNLMMPEMDGWETLAVLKQQPQTQNIPVIILSGLLPDAHQAFPDHISDWIVKPPNLQLLCQALEKATAKQNQSIKVLIIEDDLDLAQVLIAMFNRYGVTSFYAQTGREAIQISQTIIPDLLVLDLGLPEYDGFAVVDWLRQHQRLCQVPLVVYTARDLDESDREKLKLGQTLFLTKGRITAQEFEKRVVNLLNRMICPNDQ